MPIITKPVIYKGTPAIVTLDKTALAALPLVTADLYYSNLTNWNRVRVVYVSTVGSQNEVLDFNAQDTSPVATFLVSLDSRDDFLVEKILISDFDGGSLQIPRSSLVTSEFDISLGFGIYPSLPATFIKAYSENVSSPQNIQNAKLNPNYYGYDINYSVTKKMPIVDSSFVDLDGFTDFNSQIGAIKRQSDGKILLGGSFSNAKGVYDLNRFIRLNSDGTLDSQFSKNASGSNKFNGEINSIAIQSDGKILVGGSFGNYNGFYSRNNLVRLNSDGTLDTDFCINASDNNRIAGTVYSVVTQPDGKILVGGTFYKYLIRLNSDGTLDNDFISNASDGLKFSGYIYSIAIQTDEKILVGGAFSNYNGVSGRNGLVRLNSDGTIDNDFCVNAVDGKNLNPGVYTIFVQTDGKILFGGNFYGNYNISPFRRLNSDGTDDTIFLNNTGNKIPYHEHVRNINVISNGKIFISGAFYSYGGVYGRSYFVCLNSDGSIDSPYTLNSTDPYKFSSEVRGTIELDENKIAVIGTFSNYDNQKYRNYITVLNSNGSRDSVLGDAFSSNSSKFNSTIMTIATQTDGKILVGGNFTNYDSISGYNCIIRFNSDKTLDTQFCENIKNKISSGIIRAIRVQPNGQILVSGDFYGAFGVPNRNHLVRLNSDGTVDEYFCNNAVDGSKFNNTIHSIVVQPDNKILIAGAFYNYGDTSGRGRLIRLNQDGTLDIDFCNLAVDSDKITGTVFSTELQSDGKILVGGQFGNYLTSGRSYLIRIDSAGNLDTAFCANASDAYAFSNEVRVIRTHSDGKILVGGVFTGYKGSTRNFLVRLNSDGTLDTDFCANASNGGIIPTAISTLVLFKEYIIINLGYGSTYYNGNLRFLNQDGTTALTGLTSYPVNYAYIDSCFNTDSNDQRALLPTSYIWEERHYYGLLSVIIGDSSYSNLITYLGVDGLPSTELGPTGVSLSSTPTGQLQFTNDSVEGILTLNITQKPSP